MTDLCRNCAKVFCKDRDNKEECTNRVTFVQAGILEQPERRRDEGEIYRRNVENRYKTTN